jgi:hypothetical protein
MDADPDSEKQSSNNKSHFSNILQSPWVRCCIRSCDRMDRFVRDHRPNILWHIGLLFWIILPFEEEE